MIRITKFVSLASNQTKYQRNLNMTLDSNWLDVTGLLFFFFCLFRVVFGHVTTYRESICVRAQAHDVTIAIGSIAFGTWLHQAKFCIRIFIFDFFFFCFCV